MTTYNPLKHFYGNECSKCNNNIRYKKGNGCVTCSKINQKKRHAAGKSYYGPEAQLRRDLKRNYGITLESYNEMLAGQDHSCACCGKHANDEYHRLAVDHCHTTGLVRGLLCSNCNRALGFAQDDVSILQNLIHYLESHQ